MRPPGAAHRAPSTNRLAGLDLIQSWELFTDWSAEGLRAREEFSIPLAVMVWDNIPFNMERNTAPARTQAPRSRRRRQIPGSHRALPAHAGHGRRVASNRVVKFSPRPRHRAVLPRRGAPAGVGSCRGRVRDPFCRLATPKKGHRFSRPCTEGTAERPCRQEQTQRAAPGRRRRPGPRQGRAPCSAAGRAGRLQLHRALALRPHAGCLPRGGRVCPPEHRHPGVARAIRYVAH